MELTPKGRDFLRSRQKIFLTRTIEQQTETHRQGEIECDEVLFERLRDLRKKLADERNVPAYVIFSDVTLRYMAREYPTTPHDFASISGVGERKRADFGHIFTAEIADHLEEHPQQIFASVPEARERKARPKVGITPTILETLNLFAQGLDVPEIATHRGLVSSTIYSHLADAIAVGREVDLRRLLTPEQESEIAAALKKFGFGNFGEALAELGGRYEYGQFKIYRAWVQRAARAETA